VQAWEFDRRFAGHFAGQKRSRQDHRRIEDRSRHKEAQTERGSNRQSRSRSRAPSQEHLGDRAGVRTSFQLRHAEGLKRAIEGRIQALASVHRLFAETRWTGAELHRLIKEELAGYCGDGERRAIIDGPSLVMPPEIAQAVAVALHELATTAAKYGALSVAGGHVQVECCACQMEALVLRWMATGGPPVKPPTRRGFGTAAFNERSDISCWS
jgi:hypothetical protein